MREDPDSEEEEAQMGRSRRERKPRTVLQYYKAGGNPIDHVPVDNVESLVMEKPKPKPRPRLQPVQKPTPKPRPKVELVQRPIPKPRPNVESLKRALEDQQRHPVWKLFQKLQSLLEFVE